MAKIRFYEMQSLHNEWPNTNTEYDCLLVAGGSDCRAYEILRRCSENKIGLGEVLLFDFEERKKEINKELIEAYNSYQSMHLNISTIPCQIKKPSDCIKSLNDLGFDFKRYKQIAIDISCFTKPYFFSLIKYLKEYHDVSSLTVFYTEPRSYIFSKGLYGSYSSTFGPLSILEIPGYPGLETRTEKKLLIILLGFNGDLSVFITEEIAPDIVILVNGFPSYLPKFKDISLICNEKLSSTFKNSIRYAIANNPFETYNILEKIKTEYQNSFINIAPLGTKPMALGACLFGISLALT